MTTLYDVDNAELSSSARGSPHLLLREFAAGRPTLEDDVGTSMTLAKGDTCEVKIRVPEGAEYVAPTVRVSFHQPNFDVRQAWEGTVEEVGVDSFQARLRDLTDSSRPDEIVEMFREDVDSADAPLLRPGGVFYWNIGYLEGGGTPRQRTSRVTFRRLPRWLLVPSMPALSAEDIQAALAG